MLREQRLTIKVNHCIEIWSPVNFHTLRNKNTTTRKTTWRASQFSFICHLTKTNWRSVFVFFFFHKQKYMIKKKGEKSTPTTVAVGNPFFVCVCGLLTQTLRHGCLINTEAGRCLLMDTVCACVDNRSVFERLCGLTLKTRERLLWVVVVYWRRVENMYVMQTLCSTIPSLFHLNWRTENKTSVSIIKFIFMQTNWVFIKRMHLLAVHASVWTDSK